MEKHKQPSKRIQRSEGQHSQDVLDPKEIDSFTVDSEKGDDYIEGELQGFTDVFRELAFSINPIKPPKSLKQRLLQRLKRAKKASAEKNITRREKEENASLNYFLPKFRRDGHHLVRPVVDWSGDINKLLGSVDFMNVIQQSIDQLQPGDIAMIIMSELEERSYREIAAILGLSVLVVKARLLRSHLFLRGKLAAHLGHSPT